MKYIVYSLFIFGVLTSCNQKGAASNDDNKEMLSYGPSKVEPEKAITVAELLKQMENTSHEKAITFEAKIAEVCSKAGCWVNINKGDGSTFMVRFKDHFTIPPKTKVGTNAFIHGVAYWDTIPVDLLQHFAEDAGKSKEEISKITEPKFELAFEADCITFEKPKK